MDSVRRVTCNISHQEPCSRCRAPGCYWDRIAGQSCCPDCEEALAAGEGPPLVARTEKNRCAVCGRVGTVPYLTFPLHVPGAVEIDLCPEHFRALLGRRLGPYAFQQLRRQLYALGLTVEQIFLLHEVFYDSHGRALQPVIEPE
ncbi:MAG TPA: hypothetical protein VNK04_01550 [Gemmataceae bacterium]|nr:hypothetical protein [Gemmataceae bacterium]